MGMEFGICRHLQLAQGLWAEATCIHHDTCCWSPLNPGHKGPYEAQESQRGQGAHIPPHLPFPVTMDMRVSPRTVLRSHI